MFPLYDVICELGLPVLFHIGHNILDPDHSYAAPKRLSQVAQQFPKLTIIAAHMGGAIMWDQVEEHLLEKDLYLDTSLSARFCPPEQYARMIRQHDSQRIYLLPTVLGAVHKTGRIPISPSALLTQRNHGSDLLPKCPRDTRHFEIKKPPS